jgi:hypothetical protein
MLLASKAMVVNNQVNVRYLRLFVPLDPIKSLKSCAVALSGS